MTSVRRRRTQYARAVAKKEERVVLDVDGREVSVSNPAKVYFPDAGITKLDVVRYYLAVAEGALRGAGRRPNVLVRYADGIQGEYFYQKRALRDREVVADDVELRDPGLGEVDLGRIGDRYLAAGDVEDDPFGPGGHGAESTRFRPPEQRDRNGPARLTSRGPPTRIRCFPCRTS